MLNVYFEIETSHYPTILKQNERPMQVCAKFKSCANTLELTDSSFPFGWSRTPKNKTKCHFVTRESNIKGKLLPRENAE